MPLLIPNVSPTLIGPCKCIEGDMYAKLRPPLDDIHIVDWAIQFFDVGNKCNINCKLEGLDRVSSDVCVLPLVEPNLESR